MLENRTAHKPENHSNNRSFQTASSGVQRLLDARGQRGSWMPSKIFFIPLAKFLTTLFSRSPKLFHFFASVVKFHENSLLGGPPPVLHHAPVTKFFTSFLVIYLHF